MDEVTIRPFGEGEPTAVAAWAYDTPYHIYDGDPERSDDFLTIDAEGLGYYAVVDTKTGSVIGFCCFGREARVKGQQAAKDTLDIGGGVHPELVSQGLATDLLPKIMDFARAQIRRTRPGVPGANPAFVSIPDVVQLGGANRTVNRVRERRAISSSRATTQFRRAA